MMAPAHLRPIQALGRAGVPVFLARRRAAVPRRAQGPALLILGDDPMGAPSRGPAGFDSARLRAWLGQLAPGGVGVFAGDPVAEAYAALCAAASSLQGGAVLVECSAATFEAWSAYVDAQAPCAARWSVAPPELSAAPNRSGLVLEPVPCRAA